MADLYTLSLNVQKLIFKHFGSIILYMKRCHLIIQNSIWCCIKANNFIAWEKKLQQLTEHVAATASFSPCTGAPHKLRRENYRKVVQQRDVRGSGFVRGQRRPHSGRVMASRCDRSGTPLLDLDLLVPFAAGTINRFQSCTEVYTYMHILHKYTHTITHQNVYQEFHPDNTHHIPL